MPPRCEVSCLNDPASLATGPANLVTRIWRLRRRGQGDDTLALEVAALSRIALAVALVIALSACEGRNPAQVAAQRGFASKPQDTTVQPPEIPAVEPIPPETIVSEGIPTLPSEREGIRQLDLRRALDSGVVSVGANDPRFPPRLEKLVDDDTTTLARSEDVSPLILRFAFGATIRLKIVRIYLSYSTYDWKLHLDSGAPVVIREAAEEAWSEIDFPVAQDHKRFHREFFQMKAWLKLSEKEGGTGKPFLSPPLLPISCLPAIRQDRTQSR